MVSFLDSATPFLPALDDFVVIPKRSDSKRRSETIVSTKYSPIIEPSTSIMTTLTAPYSNAMRLGQGFNSCTQKICIDSAVLWDNPVRESVKRPSTPSSNGNGEAAEPQLQRQNVTYTARFVEKLSDVADAIGLSPAAAIKSGTIAFIDVDQFKESHVNYLIHCKVTNQSTVQQENLRFQKIKNLPNEKFHDTFGDTFISGFLEGGEFTALISLKVVDHRKAKDIRKQAKIALTSTTTSPEAERAANAARKTLQELCEVSVSVNWMGGGQLKDEDAPWDLDTIVGVSGKFPELVYKCPQITRAVLTKYTAIRSFLETMPGVMPLEYENIGVYMTDLLDAYMEWKTLWSQVNKIMDAPHKYEAREDTTGENGEEPKPIGLSLAELDKAKTFCRHQMLKISKEVDKISIDPYLAAEESHAPPHMSPELFACLLPKRKALPVPVETPSSPLPLFEGSLHDYNTDEKDLFTANAALSKFFLFSRRSGSMQGPPLLSQLHSIPTSTALYPEQIDIFEWDGLVRGFNVRYKGLGVLGIGAVVRGRIPAHQEKLDWQKGEKVVSFCTISSFEMSDDRRLVTYAEATTSTGKSFKVGDKNRALHRPGAVKVEVTAPKGGGLKGFYGSFGDAVDSCGVIWGR